MIFVFKTSVKAKRQVKQLKPHLDTTLSFAKWNFDLSDIDHILRVASDAPIALDVIALLQVHNYSCEELS
jgi:hypothetical protein